MTKPRKDRIDSERVRAWFRKLIHDYAVSPEQGGWAHQQELASVGIHPAWRYVFAESYTALLMFGVEVYADPGVDRGNYLLQYRNVWR